MSAVDVYWRRHGRSLCAVGKGDEHWMTVLPSTGVAGCRGCGDWFDRRAVWKERLMNEPVAVYVHTPFCPSKCGYCDFNSYAMDGQIVDRTVNAIERQIRRSEFSGRPAKTVFFGGGTPTFLASQQIERLLEAVLDVHPPIEGCEITSEANPGTVDMPKFEGMRRAGFNRLSLGAQSFHTNDLIQLGRVHDASQIGRAIEMAREAGFDNLNLDLMFGLPGQSMRAWTNNLSLALKLRPEHLSLYCLTIEPNTRYYRLHLKGMLDLPDDESQVEMYDLACQLCTEAGYEQYEISNFAKSGRECQHNLCYWHGEEYVAYGPGSVGCVQNQESRVRYVVTKHPIGYCEAVEANESLWCEQETLASDTQRIERIMLGIRLNEGLEIQETGLSQNVINDLVSRHWVTETNGCITLTPNGRHFCSEVALALI